MDKPRRAWPSTAGLFILVAVAISLPFVRWIDLRPVIESDQVVFRVPFVGINGILGFSVRDEEGVVWSIGTHYETGHKIIYGELPSGGNRAAQQIVPDPGQAPPDICGKKVLVKVVYQYDNFVSACRGTFEKEVIIPERPHPAR